MKFIWEEGDIVDNFEFVTWEQPKAILILNIVNYKKETYCIFHKQTNSPLVASNHKQTIVDLLNDLMAVPKIFLDNLVRRGS